MAKIFGISNLRVTLFPSIEKAISVPPHPMTLEKTVTNFKKAANYNGWKRQK